MRPLVLGLMIITWVFGLTTAQAQQPAVAPPTQPDELRERFKREVIEPMRQRSPSAFLTPMEYTSERLRKLLPECRVFVAVGAGTGFGLYVFDAEEKLHSLEGNFGFKTGDEYAVDPAVSDFFTSQGLVIRNEKDAIEVAALVAEVTSCPMVLSQKHDEIWLLKRYDPADFQSSGGKNPDWEQFAVRDGDQWFTTWRYVGPPASIDMPVVWALQVDERGRLVNVRQGVGRRSMELTQ